MVAAAIGSTIHVPLHAQAGPPRVSPRAEVSQTVGTAAIDIVYNRPSARGRTVWNELVPYGKLWRTGANEATTFAISHDAMIGDRKLAAGTYALFTIPDKDRWTLIFNEDSEQWGGFGHDPEKDALRIEVEAKATSSSMETFLITIPEVDQDSAVVQLNWTHAVVSFEVVFDTVAVTFAKAQAEIAEAGAGSRVAFGWARYYQGEGTHLDAALAWIDAVVVEMDHYWTHSTRARILARMDRHAEAKEAVAHAMTVIDQAPNPEAAKGDAARLREEAAGWP